MEFKYHRKYGVLLSTFAFFYLSLLHCVGILEFPVYLTNDGESIVRNGLARTRYAPVLSPKRLAGEII